MNWIVLVDAGALARWVVVACLLVVAGLAALGLWWVDRRQSTQRAREIQADTWDRAKRFMEVGAESSLAFLTQQRGRDLSKWQRRVVDQWIEAHRRVRDE
mgnify:CR=1 FL=1